MTNPDATPNAVIATVVTFRHTQKSYDRTRLEAINRSTAPKYAGLDGLVSKAYWYDDAALENGGIYLWSSREAAEATHDEAHLARLEELYGVRPSVRWMDVPVFVNNATGAPAKV
ncbi:MAG: YdhR family protein [Dehalococcoidia bacterium]